MSGGNKKIKILGLGHDHEWAAWQETQVIPAGIEIVEFCWRSGLDEFITMVHSHRWDLALVDYRHLQSIPAFAGSSISPYIAHHITLAFLLRDEEEYRRLLLEGNAEIPVLVQREDPLALANAIHCYLHKLRISPAIEQIKHYLQLLNLSHEAILFFNGRGDIFFANNAASQLYEQAPQHLIMKNLFSLFPEDCHQELHDLITQTRHNHYGKTSLIFTRDAEKTHRFKRISLNTYRIDSASSNCDAELLQIAMLIKPDDLQQISQSVLQSVQRLSHIKVLLQGCVHDLNNILSPITLGTFLLRARTNDPQLEAAIDRIEESAERGSELIHQIQAIAENTSIPHIQAKHILRAIMHAFRNSVPPDIQVLWEIPREFPVLKIDVLEFEQVVLNVLINAVEAITLAEKPPATPEVKLKVHVRKETAGVDIDISNNGPPIPEDLRASIFKPFFSSKETHHLGVGLDIARSLARKHDGDLILLQSDPTQTVFRISLPALSVPEQEFAQTPKESHDDASRNLDAQILVYAQQKNIADLLTSVLKEQGYKHVHHFKEAQALLVHVLNHPNLNQILILADQPVPWQLAEFIRVVLAFQPQLRILYPEDPAITPSPNRHPIRLPISPASLFPLLASI